MHHGLALFDNPRVHAQVRELPKLRLLQFECKGDKRTVAVALKDHLLLILVEVERRVRHLGGIREEVVHAVEQQLHPLVLVGAAHSHGHKGVGNCGAPDACRTFSKVSTLVHLLHKGTTEGTFENECQPRARPLRWAPP